MTPFQEPHTSCIFTRGSPEGAVPPVWTGVGRRRPMSVRLSILPPSAPLTSPFSDVSRCPSSVPVLVDIVDQVRLPASDRHALPVNDPKTVYTICISNVSGRWHDMNRTTDARKRGHTCRRKAPEVAAFRSSPRPSVASRRGRKHGIERLGRWS